VLPDGYNVGVSANPPSFLVFLHIFKKEILTAFIIILAIYFFNYFVFFLFIFFIVSAMSYAGTYSNFSLLVLRHHAVGPWSTTMTTQFLSSIWTVQDGQVAISRC